MHTPSTVRRVLLVLLLLSATASLHAQLRILSPNRGERYRVGSRQTITWTGVAASDTVVLEYSTNNGASWNPITDRAIGLQHLWFRVPNTPSEFCLMRATTKPSVGDSVLYLESRRPGFILPDAIHYAEFSPDGSRVIGGSAGGDVFIWNSLTGAIIDRFPVEPGPFPSRPGITHISSVHYSPDGRFFVTISPIEARVGSTIRIFDASTGAKLLEWRQDEGGSASTSSECEYSPDGTRLLVGGLDGGAIYRTSDGSLVATIKGYSVTDGSGNTSITSLRAGDWRRDGMEIIGTSGDVASVVPEFIVTDPATGDTIRSFRGPGGSQTSTVRFNPAGDRFISSATSGSVRIQDATTGATLFDIRDYDLFPVDARYSPDGRFFATAGQDSDMLNWKLHLYDATSGAFVKTIGAIINGMRNLHFSPDGARVLVSCIDGVRIFHAPAVTAAQTDISDSLWAIEALDGASVLVSAPIITARQGEIVEVPITIDDAESALAAGATRIDMRLRYDVTLLDPIAPTPRGTFDAESRTIGLSFPIPSSDTLLGVLRFKAALGDDSTTTLDILDAAADDSTVTVFDQDGLFRLADLCYADGPRLVNPSGAVTIKVASLADGTIEIEATTIEAGRTRLELVDIEGRVVARFLDGEAPAGVWRRALDLQQVSSGRYFLLLTTPSVRKSIPMEVTR